MNQQRGKSLLPVSGLQVNESKALFRSTLMEDETLRRKKYDDDDSDEGEDGLVIEGAG